MLITTHLELFSLTAFLAIMISQSISYCQILYINMLIASDPLMIEKLDSPLQRRTYLKANSEFVHWSCFVLPGTIISFLTTIIIWYLVSHDYILSTLIIWLTVITITTSITSFIRNELYPDWLFKWTIVLTNTQTQINLEQIQNRLKELKNELIEAEQNKTSQTEVNWLKFECLTLSREAFILTNNYEEVQKIDDLLNIKKEP